MSLFNRLNNQAVRTVSTAGMRRQLAFAGGDTALVLVGTQRDLLTAAGTVAAIAQLLGAVRAGGLPVIYARAAAPTPEHGIAHPTPSQRALLDGNLLGEGSPGAGIHDAIAPSDTDIVLEPSAAVSAFSGTALAARLAEVGAERILIAGARTDVEVDSTARDALEEGLQVTLVVDCCAGTTPAAHHTTIATTMPRVVQGLLTLSEVRSRMP